ncbi:MAG: hypothetical protein RSA10_02290 [Bacilli bacterium]
MMKKNKKQEIKIESFNYVDSDETKIINRKDVFVSILINVSNSGKVCKLRNILFYLKSNNSVIDLVNECKYPISCKATDKTYVLSSCRVNVSNELIKAGLDEEFSLDELNKIGIDKVIDLIMFKNVIYLNPFITSEEEELRRFDITETEQQKCKILKK